MTVAIETDAAPATPRPLARQRSGIAHRGDFRWTLEEYYKLEQVGLFKNKRTELIQGVLYIMGTPDEPHTNLVMRTARLLRRLFDEDVWSVREEKGLVVEPDTDIGPDLAVVPLAGYSPDRKPSQPWLCIEVAFNSLKKDLAIKADVYAAAGTPLYVVIAARRRCVFVHVDPRPNALSSTGFRFASVLRVEVGGTVTLNDPAKTEVPVAVLLGEATA